MKLLERKVKTFKAADIARVVSAKKATRNAVAFAYRGDYKTAVNQAHAALDELNMIDDMVVYFKVLWNLSPQIYQVMKQSEER